MTRHSLALMLEGLRRAGQDLAEAARATYPADAVLGPWEGPVPDETDEEHNSEPAADIEPLGDDEPREDYVRDWQARFEEDDADALASAGRGTDEDYGDPDERD